MDDTEQGLIISDYTEVMKGLATLRLPANPFHPTQLERSMSEKCELYQQAEQVKQTVALVVSICPLNKYKYIRK